MMCPICSKELKIFSEALVLKRHKVKYYRCLSCGFTQTEEPYWLSEAYQEPIARTDSGLLARNIRYARIVMALIRWGGLRGPVLDHAGGYGILTRILCDHGIDADWCDPFCENLFSKDHVYSDQKKYNLVTAFESLEHQIKPVEYLKQLLTTSQYVLFSTEVIPSRLPKPGEWWYYNPEAGQHISFFSQRSLAVMAHKLSVHYVSFYGLHLFSARPFNKILFVALANDFTAKLVNCLY